MAQVGGSATLYGVLYQALGSGLWASTIALKSELSGHDFASAQLIIEPQGGGGDIVVASGRRRIVEQWKAKADRGTWSVKSLVIEVLPDLYRAVNLAQLTVPVEYRFVSEGRAGRWKALQELFDKSRAIAATENPLSVLDGSEYRSYISDSKMTEREFFSWMINSLRQHEDIAQDPMSVARQKLWHLVANFRFISGRTLEKVQNELDYLLFGAVDFREQIPGKRRELCGLVLELAGQGEVKISPLELLSRVQINSKSFTEWASLQDRLGEEAGHRVRREWHYHPDQDVRAAPNWPDHRPVLILAGESGQGKTWQLGALAMGIVATEGLVATVTATGDARYDLQAASNMVWQSVLGHDQELSLERLVEKHREIAPKLEGPWLTIFIDDVLSIDEARRIVSQDWKTYGARLAITTLPSIARSIQSQFRELVQVVDVKDFSVIDAQEYLRRFGHNWGQLPADVREILKRPLLARLFVELAADANWMPTHEYELFERFWLRIRDARNQVEHPEDSTWLMKLAGTVLDESSPYPWLQSALVDIGLPSEVQVRLESIGWLRRLDGDRVEVWHDRVLNWAVAEELVSRLEQQKMSAQALCETIAMLWGSSVQRSGRYLGYVPLDVLWIIGGSSHLRAELPSLIEALENAPRTRHYLDPLYNEHLPTLGERIIGGIVDRVRSASKGNGIRYKYYAANAIKKISLTNAIASASWGRTLISDPDSELQQVGLQVLAITPESTSLDRLWELHQKHCRDKHSEEFASWWPKYDASFAALCAVVRLRPEWLGYQIDIVDSKQSPVHELAYLLASLEGEPGRRLWQEKKEVLFSKVASGKRRCLARCIEHYHDDSEIDRLEEWLSIDVDLLAPTALMALSRILPNHALRALRLIRPMDLYSCRNWWLPQLIARCPGETQAEICQLMLAGSPNDVWVLASVYQDSMHLMDKDTLRLLLENLKNLIKAHLEGAGDTKIDLFRPLTLIAEVASSQLLSVFESYAESTLERYLVDVAQSRLDHDELDVDHELEGIRSILVKINGSGLTELINAELNSKSKYSRLKGVQKSLMRPDRITRERLRSQVDYEEYWNDNELPLVQKKAGVMLAALGENAAVVQSILRWKGMLNELSQVRYGMASMSDIDLSEAFKAIKSGEDGQCVEGMWALSVSGRADLAPIVIDVLKRADPTSELAKSAVWALGDIGCCTAEAVSLIEPQLNIKHHKYAAVTALAEIGTSEAIASMEHYLSEHGIEAESFEDIILAATLCRHSASRLRVANAVWQIIHATPHWDGSSELFESLLLLEEEPVKEWLIDQAYEPEGVIHVQHRRVWIIRTLAKIDKEAAFQACESAIFRGYQDIPKLTETLIDLDPERAVPLVCAIASHKPKAGVRYAIGHALRGVKQKELISAALENLLQSQNAAERRIALELAGWAGPGAVATSTLRAAIDDHTIMVRIAACNALRRHEVEIDVEKLLTLLKESRGARTWSLLDAILISADPNALQSKNDSLFLGNAYPNDDMPYWLYCKQPLERRIKDIDKELEDMDKKDD